MENLPGWDNSSEYTAFDSPQFLKDYEEAIAAIQKIETFNQALKKKQGVDAIPTLQTIAQLEKQVYVLLHSLRVYTHCESTLDAKNTTADRWTSLIQKLSSSYQVALVPKQSFLKECEDKTIEAYLNSDQTKDEAFQISKIRALKDFALEEETEKTIEELAQYGLHSWGNLYSQIAGKLKVTMPTYGTIGMAAASGYLRSSDEQKRKEAWEGIRDSWTTMQDPAAAILNNLAGFRLDIAKKRSSVRPMTFLTEPLHSSAITEETLTAMNNAIEKRLPILHEALRYGAKLLGKNTLDPWDTSAPYPVAKNTNPIEFLDGLEIVRSAMAGVSAEMGQFVTMMHKNNWIEARILPNKRPGGFCTKFPKSRTPRIYQSYSGSLSDVATLAHELGHAYHNWILKELPLVQTQYPMTLAETASLFSETVVNEALLEKLTGEEKKAQAWAEVNHAVMLLVNISARFEFEKNFYEARKNGTVSAEEISELTNQAWKKWYGNTLSTYESHFWMSKMHFSISTLSFYNFPYSFGYLFALVVYAQKDRLGKDFVPFYHALLKDTGRMTAEELILKHFNLDTRTEEFWNHGLDVVQKKIKALV